MDAPQDPSAIWEDRYNGTEFLYGTEPNDFLRSQLNVLAPTMGSNDALCYADGEGRNSVYVAEQGWRTTAVDLTRTGIAKGQQLAEMQGVHVTGIVADLAEWDLGVDRWDLIVSIFAHLPPDVRRDLHRRVVIALRPGATFILEAYTPDQIGRGTGGPPDAALTMTATGLRDELKGLAISELAERERSVVEGTGHTGAASVVQLVAHKPLPD